MVLSKALKAKLSSIPSGVASLLTPGLDQNGGEKTAANVVGPSSTTCHGNSSCARGAALFSSSQMVVCVRTELRVLSLSVRRKVDLPLTLW